MLGVYLFFFITNEYFFLFLVFFFSGAVQKQGNIFFFIISKNMDQRLVDRNHFHCLEVDNCDTSTSSIEPLKKIKNKNTKKKANELEKKKTFVKNYIYHFLV